MQQHKMALVVMHIMLLSKDLICTYQKDYSTSSGKIGISVDLINNRIGSLIKWNLLEGEMDALFSFVYFSTNDPLKLTALIFINSRSLVSLPP